MTEKLRFSENHRRAISILLRGIERMCDQIDISLQAGPGILYRLDDNLSGRQRNKLYQIAEGLRGEIRRLAEEMELDSGVKSPRRTILALLSAHIVNLQESDSAGLRGYGTMPEAAARRLDAETVKLIRLLEEMSAVLKEEPGT